MDSMHVKGNLTSAKTSDPGLTEATDEEIEARAVRWIMQAHEDEIRRLDEDIASSHSIRCYHGLNLLLDV